jgi:U1 small nuclear ribonucleoprotein
MSGGKGMRKMTAKGEMSGNGSGPALAYLPDYMKPMFLLEEPLKILPPVVKRKKPTLVGLAQFVEHFETTEPPPRGTFEDPLQRKERKRVEKLAQAKANVEEALKEWNPKDGLLNPVNGEVTGNAYNTLFVARLSYDTTNHKLRREFEEYGPVKSLRIVQDKSGESRGYAFVEFEDERDMKDAFRRADGRKVDGRRVLVDVERGRTSKQWVPRRFGGGRGNTRDARKAGEKPRPPTTGRAVEPSGSAGGSSAAARGGHYARPGGTGGGPPPSATSRDAPHRGGDSAGGRSWGQPRRDGDRGGDQRGGDQRGGDRGQDRSRPRDRGGEYDERSARRGSNYDERDNRYGDRGGGRYGGRDNDRRDDSRKRNRSRSR